MYLLISLNNKYVTKVNLVSPIELSNHFIFPYVIEYSSICRVETFGFKAQTWTLNEF